MTRQSSIVYADLETEIANLLAKNMRYEDIIEYVDAKFGVVLSKSALSRFLVKQSTALSELRDEKQTLTLDAFRQALMDAISEAKNKYDSFKDDPKAGWAWFKHYLDTLDRMGRVVGAFDTETQINGPFAVPRDQNDPACVGCYWHSHMTMERLRELLKEG